MAIEAEHPRTLSDFAREVRQSIERTRGNKMEMVRQRQQRQQQASLTNTIVKYKLLVAVALLGALLATWQVLRR